jgi:hypothetical protein
MDRGNFLVSNSARVKPRLTRQWRFLWLARRRTKTRVPWEANGLTHYRRPWRPHADPPAAVSSRPLRCARRPTLCPGVEGETMLQGRSSARALPDHATLAPADRHCRLGSERAHFALFCGAKCSPVSFGHRSALNRQAPFRARRGHPVGALAVSCGGGGGAADSAAARPVRLSMRPGPFCTESSRPCDSGGLRANG